MKKTNLYAVSLSLLLVGCSGLNAPVPAALLGDAATDAAAERTIVIDPAIRYVNVTGGEIIRFNVGNKSFTWHFDGALGVTQFSLQQIMPADLLDHAVTAYVRPNPFLIGGDKD